MGDLLSKNSASGIPTVGRRALHYVLKIGNRNEAIDVLRDILGMQVLRHEEFDSGCEATCNGPYDGRWSKTMIGFGREDENFVLELTYNYGVNEYGHGNDYIAIDILKKDISVVAAAEGVTLETLENKVHALVIHTNGYRFNIIQDDRGDKIERVRLASTDLAKTMDFYTKTLDMKQIGDDLVYAEDQGKLKFTQFEGKRWDRGYAFGRVAYACPTDQLMPIEKLVEKATYGGRVQVPFITLPTPGKSNVHVIIVADPDQNEICYVGDEEFRVLSQLDPNANELLNNSLKGDRSEEWYASKGLSKDKRMD